MPTALITGANRGIGLELARQYAGEGYAVHACCRTPAYADKLGTVPGDVTVHALDVTDHAAMDALAATVTGPIDVLIANAGVYGPSTDAQTFGGLDYDALRDALETNTLGAIKTLEAFADHVAEAKGKMIAVTSKMGSIGDASAGMIAYRASKAALNMGVAMAAAVMADRGVAVAVIHPGWVRTDMGGPKGLVSAEESAAGIRGVVAGLKPAPKAPFLAYDGQEIPW